MRRRLRFLIPMVTLLATVPAVARDQFDGIRACLRIDEDYSRLKCYDREVHALNEPRYAGRLNMVTERFTIDRPTRLRYQSDGAIFVLYLKTDDDRVVQNLHIGGGGEDSYLIEQPGTYFLQINGSESWRIWLEDL